MPLHEKQLTFDLRHHQLTNAQIWTPDSQWLVYDVRPSGAQFTGLTIEKVRLTDGHCAVIYQAQDGAHVGVVTVSHQSPVRYVFIHGPEHPDTQWHYDFHHRRGVIVNEHSLGIARTLDACSITAPYFPGALRGGSHVHMFSGDDRYISFTYNDHVLHEYDPVCDLRNVGIAFERGPVNPPLHHPREYSGSHFCVLVSQTTVQPRPGSDDINRAYEESWIGDKGYLRADGSRQTHALAFIGDTVSLSGERVAEIFIVDLPKEETLLCQAGEQPLQGTCHSMPAPPIGIQQRRVTFTHQRTYPGLVSQPRHWLRSAPDGSAIACLMRDDAGIVQLYLVTPQNDSLRQLTHLTHGVASAFSWSPQGDFLFFVEDQRVVRCDSQHGALLPLTEKQDNAPLSADAVICSPDGQWVAFIRQINGINQICVAATLINEKTD